MTQSLDNKILEMRLLYKDSVISMPSITKCAKQLNLYQKNLKDIALLEGFLNESLSYKLEVDKTMEVFAMLEAQEREYDELETVIQNKINVTRNNIILSEEELKQQLLIRSHRLECEHVAAIVNKRPSCSVLKRKIDSITNSLEGTKNSIEQVSSEIANKKALYDILLKAMEDLKRPEDVTSGNQMDVVSNDEDAIDDDLNVDDSSRGINNRTKDHDDLDIVGSSSVILTISDEDIVDEDDLAVKLQQQQHEQQRDDVTILDE